MWFTRVSIANPVMATMVMLAFVVLGLFIPCSAESNGARALWPGSSSTWA